MSKHFRKLLLKFQAKFVSAKLWNECLKAPNVRKRLAIRWEVPIRISQLEWRKNFIAVSSLGLGRVRYHSIKRLRFRLNPHRKERASQRAPVWKWSNSNYVRKLVLKLKSTSKIWSRLFSLIFKTKNVNFAHNHWNETIELHQKRKTKQNKPFHLNLKLTLKVFVFLDD